MCPCEYEPDFIMEGNFDSVAFQAHVTTITNRTTQTSNGLVAVILYVVLIGNFNQIVVKKNYHN